MSDRMRVVSTTEEGGRIYAVRDDGVYFWWDALDGAWRSDNLPEWMPTKPVPGCEAGEMRPGTAPLSVTEPELSLICDAVHRYRSSASGALRDQLDRLWRSLVSSSDW